MLYLTAEETRAIDEVVARQSRRAKYPISFDKLVERWTRFVAQVEHGYTDSIYEYTNDLSARDLIQEVLDHVPEELRGKLLILVQPSDERFNEATQVIAHPIAGRKDMNMQPWWFRIPKRVSGELADDLQAAGLM